MNNDETQTPPQANPLSGIINKVKGAFVKEDGGIKWMNILGSVVGVVAMNMLLPGMGLINTLVGVIGGAMGADFIADRRAAAAAGDTQMPGLAASAPGKAPHPQDMPIVLPQGIPSKNQGIGR